jgi:prepilin-type N-terminal cleavage/methylation domain-containing protein
VREHRRIQADRSGFTAAELLVVIAIIGIIAAVGTPVYLSYLRASTLKGGAQELVTILNRGRQLAISQNTTICVSQGSNKVRFIQGGCSGAGTIVWTGPGTDSNGWLTLQNGVNVSSATANAVFDYMGAAASSGIYTVQNPVNNATLTVTVALSGRVTIGP